MSSQNTSNPTTRWLCPPRAIGALQVVVALCLSNAAMAQISFQNTTNQAGVQGNATESFGASWGDLNRDGYPDLFIGNHRDVSRLWLNNGDGTFTDISDSAVSSNAFEPRDKHGAAFVDLNADGSHDLVMTVSTTDGRYLISNGVSQLTEAGPSLGLDLQHDNGSRMPVAFDADGDGRIDLKIIGNRENASNFFRQNNNGTFSLVPNQLGISCPKGTQWGQLLDVDASGTLELLCGGGSEFPTKVIDYNSGFGSSVSFDATRRSRDGIAGDFNNDGRQDLMHVMGSLRLNEALRVSQTRVEAHMVITSGVPSRTLTIDTGGRLVVALGDDNWNFITSKGGSASDVYIGASGYNPSSLTLDLHPSGANLGVQAPGNRDGMFVGYVDGKWSVTVNASNNSFINGYFVFDSNQFISSASMTPTLTSDEPFPPLLELNMPGGFVDSTAASGLTAERCVSGIAADLDNDMDLDIFLGCRLGAQNLANVVFENLGGGVFSKVNNHGGEGITGANLEDGAGTSESVVWADYDVDGFVDVFVTNGLHLFPFDRGGPSELFRNNGNSNNWIQIDLVGIASNRDAVGAKVRLTAGGVTQYREQNGGYHRWSQNSQRIHFGLASNTSADLEIEWPSGQVDNYNIVEVNALFRATEAQGLVTVTGGQTDSDSDGLLDDDEIQLYGTDPNNPDTDGGGALDGAEVARGTDPLDPSDDEFDSFCGEPVYSRSVDRGTFIWKDCEGSGEWYIRTTGGGTSSLLIYTANIKLPGGPTSISTFSFENSDVLDSNSNPDIVSYQMRIWGTGEDGINFVAPPDSCFTPGQPGGLPVYVGKDRTELLTSTLDLQTGGACPDTGGGDGDVCGAPDISVASDRGTFLWKDCDGSNQWHAIVSAGGVPGLSLFEGRIDAPGGLLSLSEVSIESSDLLDQVSNPDALKYSLRTFNVGFDGFDFVPPADACFASTDAMPVLLGKDKTPLLTANIDLSTGLQCESTGGDGSACGSPTINYTADDAAFLWQNCTTGEWSARFSAASAFTVYEGSITSDLGFDSVTGVDLEGSDTLNDNGNDVFYNLRIGAGFNDGFDFTIPDSADACFDLQLPEGAVVLVGESRVAVPTPFNPETLGPCTPLP